jgi:GNAT superfamily N-acetyltransferase
VIRRADPADAAALAELATRIFIDTYGAYNNEDDLAAYLAETYSASLQEKEIADPDIVTLIAEEDGQLAAFAQVRRQPPPECVTEAVSVEIWRFYVDRSWHGRGLAQRLMAGAFDAARELGTEKRVWLGVWERNPRAIAFYEKCGFKDVGPKSFLIGEDLQTDRVLIAEI